MTIYRKLSFVLMLFLLAFAMFIVATWVWTQVPASGKQLSAGVFMAGTALAVGLWRNEDPNTDWVFTMFVMPCLFIGIGFILGGVLFAR